MVRNYEPIREKVFVKNLLTFPACCESFVINSRHSCKSIVSLDIIEMYYTKIRRNIKITNIIV